MDKLLILDKIKGGLIVSCQALEEEPLHGADIMSKMALAAKWGGAIGIRSNSYVDIVAIKKEVDLPVIGIVKKIYSDSEIYITPTLKEVEEVVSAGAEIIALDATNRIRPNNQNLTQFFQEVRSKFPNKIFMADISNYEEAIKADELGFDIVGTTLAGYTPYTKGTILPDFELMKRIVNDLNVPIIAEGGVWTPEHLKKAMEIGVHAVVVGTAITRPMEITKRFVEVLN